MKIITLFPNADMAELVDAPDLKSVEYCTRAGSIPAVGIFDNQRVTTGGEVGIEAVALSS